MAYIEKRKGSGVESHAIHEDEFTRRRATGRKTTKESAKNRRENQNHEVISKHLDCDRKQKQKMEDICPDGAEGLTISTRLTKRSTKGIETQFWSRTKQKEKRGLRELA